MWKILWKLNGSDWEYYFLYIYLFRSITVTLKSSWLHLQIIKMMFICASHMSLKEDKSSIFKRSNCKDFYEVISSYSWGCGGSGHIDLFFIFAFCSWWWWKYIECCERSKDALMEQNRRVKNDMIRRCLVIFQM